MASPAIEGSSFAHSPRSINFDIFESRMAYTYCIQTIVGFFTSWVSNNQFKIVKLNYNVIMSLSLF